MNRPGIFRRMYGLLGSIKYRTKNLLEELSRGVDPSFNQDLRVIGPMVRTAFYNSKPVGFKTRVMLTERIVEYPLVFQLIPSKPTTILDIGSGDSPLPYQLASLGHTVHAVDVIRYPLRHPHLHIYQHDALHLPFDAESMPFATAISSLEHFGLGGYGDPEVPGAPFQARDEIVRVLKQGGRLLASFPVGLEVTREQSKKRNYIVFTREMVKKFTRGMTIQSSKYYCRMNGHWNPCDSEQAFRVDSYTNGAAAVGIVLLEKKKGMGSGRTRKRSQH